MWWFLYELITNETNHEIADTTEKCWWPVYTPDLTSGLTLKTKVHVLYCMYPMCKVKWKLIDTFHFWPEWTLTFDQKSVEYNPISNYWWDVWYLWSSSEFYFYSWSCLQGVQTLTSVWPQVTFDSSTFKNSNWFLTKAAWHTKHEGLFLGVFASQSVA